MSRGIFVTGTDTGVGKTLVAAGIVRQLRRAGIDAVPMKPVQTGAEKSGKKLIAPDLEFSLAAAGLKPAAAEKSFMLPYAYEPACSPHLAGRMAHSYPELSRIKECADALLQKHKVVVEGAGGVMAPLNETQTTLDLIQMLGFPVVLVSRLGLGTINHTLLSLYALRGAGVGVAGVIFNHTEPPSAESQFIEEDNPAAVARFGKMAVLGKVRFFANVEPKDAALWRQFDEDTPGLQDVLRELSL